MKFNVGDEIIIKPNITFPPYNPQGTFSNVSLITLPILCDIKCKTIITKIEGPLAYLSIHLSDVSLPGSNYTISKKDLQRLFKLDPTYVKRKILS